MTKLYIAGGPMEGTSTELKGEITFVGRASDNDIQIKDRSISRKHIKIIGKNSRFFIEDLGSENGTWINGKPIKPGYEFEVEKGFPIAIGDTLICLGKKCSEDGSKHNYSINISKEVSWSDKDLPYKERRITNQRELELIYELSSDLMQSLDTKEICQKIMDSLFSRFKRIDGGTIILIDDNTGELKEVIARSRDKTKGNKRSYSQTIVNRVIRDSRAVMMSDTSQEDEENLSDSILKSKIKSIMCVPLISKSKTRGVIYVHSVKEPYGFRKDDLFLLTGLSYPAAVTLENALLYSKRKQPEEALRKARDDLENRVEERTEELSRINALLRESEEKYRNLFDNIRDFIYTHDLEGLFLTVNRAAAQTLGYAPEDLIGRPVSDLMLPEYRQAFQEEYLTQIKKEGSLDGVTKYLARDSSQHYIEYRSVLVEQEGKEPYVSGIGRNITDRILRQREVKKLEQQLQHAQKMEAIGTLAGGIAHDFNNLLMGILGHISLMSLDMDESHAQFERLKTIEKHVQLGADLTNQLLGFARGGKYEVKTTDVNQLVRNSSEMFGRAKKEITIHSKYQEDLWPVDLDRGQIENVLLNLYVNAWQAMPGAGELYIETDNITLDEHYVKPYKVKPGRYVKISITDTGVGMDKVTQRRIFEPFFTTKEMGRGTGLGLASAYGIVKNHGGYINVYSEKDKGTTFRIYLPASEKEISEKKELSEKVVKGTGTLLLVDDEDIVIGVGEPMLKTLGYEALVARSGREAIEIYKDNQDRIDMVILDMIMSDMSGGETFDRLKEISPGIKVLLSSGYSIEGQATEILSRGCNGFIQKPFNMSELSKKIGEILAR